MNMGAGGHMKKVLWIVAGVVCTLGVLGAVGYGGWYAWDVGLVGKNPRAPTAEAMAPVVNRTVAALRTGRAGTCVSPDAQQIQPDAQGRPGIAPRQAPGQHAATYLLQGSPHTQLTRDRLLKQMSFLAKQGLYTEHDASLETDAGPQPAKEYRLTWKGFAALSQEYGPCFSAGARAFGAIGKIEKVVDNQAALEVWEVSLPSSMQGVPEWAASAEAKALFPRLAEMSAPRTEKVRVIRGKEGWLSEQEMQTQLHLAKLRSAGQDVSALVGMIARGGGQAVPLVLDDAAARKLVDEYLAGEQWQARGASACVPVQFQRGGDERQAGAFDRTTFTATWLDKPATERRPHELKTMLTQLHLLSAVERSGFAKLEPIKPVVLKPKRGEKPVAPPPGGARFDVLPEAVETLGMSSRGCVPVGRFGKVELIGVSPTNGGMRVAARGTVEALQPWAKALALHLPALRHLADEGVPLTGRLQFGPKMDRDGVQGEPRWYVSHLQPTYAMVAGDAVPEPLVALFPLTAQASVKVVKGPVSLPSLPVDARRSPVR
jgi:hypothetical protein